MCPHWTHVTQINTVMFRSKWGVDVFKSQIRNVPTQTANSKTTLSVGHNVLVATLECAILTSPSVHFPIRCVPKILVTAVPTPKVSTSMSFPAAVVPTPG